MQKIVIDIFMYIFEALLLWHYANSLFEPKKSKAFCGLISIIAHAILLLIYQLGITYLNGICLLVTYCLFFMVLYRASIKSAVFHALVLITVMFATELLVMAIGTVFFKDFNALENSLAAYLYVIILSKLLHIIIILALCKLFAFKSEKEPYNRYYWLLFLSPIASVLTMTAFRYLTYEVDVTPFVSRLWIVASILTIFSNVLVFIIYEYSNKNTRELYELKALARQEEYDRKYYDVVEQSNNEMRVFAHDIKNHLFALSQMSDNPEVKSYIEKISGEIQKIGKGCDSGNHTLDIILNKYVAECDRNGVFFEYDVKLANLNFVEDYDLVTIVGNLLDNALEAAEQSAEKKITLNTAKVNTYDSLTVTNSCDTPPDKNLKTTKKNKQMHGLGIKSIQKAVKKYDGELEWEYDENEKQFSITIILLSKTV